MADVTEAMYCEIVFRLDGGDLDFLCVCVCVCVCACACVCVCVCLCVDDSRSWYIVFLLVCVPVKGHRFA